MVIKLKRIKKSNFDDVMDLVIKSYISEGKITLPVDILESNSEIINVNGREINLDIDIEQYKKIVSDDVDLNVKKAKVGMLLHHDMHGIDGTKISQNILYEPEVWAYLTFKVFSDIIPSLRKNNGAVWNQDQIERLCFNTKTITRTGLLHLWSMIDVLESENNEEMSLVAFHFIDPVKAVFERTMSKNPMVLKAFVQAIIENGMDPRIKRSNSKNKAKDYRTLVPNSVSCYARINMLDAYDYEDLVSTMTVQIKNVLDVI